VAALLASARSTMQALDARWGCVASAEGDTFVVTPTVGDEPVMVPALGSFFAQVRSADTVVVASREAAASFAGARLVDFAPRLLVGVALGRGDVLVVADEAARFLDPSELAAVLDIAATARELVAVERRATALSTLFDTSPDAMLVVADDGHIVEANRGAETLLGYRASELFSMTIEDLVPLAARDGHARSRAAYSASPSSRQMGTRASMSALRRDGTEVPVDIMLGTFTTDDVTHVLAVLRDMTAREEAFATLRAREEQLRQAQRLEVLGQFAASIAHDFNNLLTVVSSCSELIASDPSLPPSLRSEVDDVRTAAARGGLLTRQLLGFARSDVPQRRAVSVADVCEDLRSVLQRLIGTSHRLVLSVAPDLGLVLADAVHVEQILMNLVVNARDAMPAGMTIRVVARRVDVAPGVGDVPPGGYVALEVSDTGAGIAPDVLPRIFEPRFTTKPADRGTGLGLAIVRRVVTESDGHVRVETAVGRGTTFTVFLPRLADPSQPPARRAPSVLPRGIRVLVVDDEPVNLRLLVTLLTRAGYDVTDASSAEAALVLGRSSPPDLLVTDVSLLDASGPELVASLRAAQPGLRAMFVTGNPASCRAEALRCAVGDVPILEKPFSAESLTAHVEGALATPLNQGARLWNNRAP